MLRPDRAKMPPVSGRKIRNLEPLAHGDIRGVYKTDIQFFVLSH